MKLKHRLITEVQRMAPSAAAASASSALPASATDWNLWLRLIERKRRIMSRVWPFGRQFSLSFLLGMTTVSFRLDGVEVSDAEATDAMTESPKRNRVRSRLGQRLRNHLAILRSIQRLLSAGQALTVSTVVRWYTSVSCGLSTSSLSTATMDRISAVVGRMSSPRLRLKPAVQEVAQLHAQLMLDPLVPSFNGIMTRLLLCYHLGRCGLPPVLFDPILDMHILANESKLLPRLMDLIDQSYSLMLTERLQEAS
jgi:hypothetical protein